MKSRRSKLTKKGSKRLFKSTADKTHSINIKPTPMRGGFRI